MKSFLWLLRDLLSSVPSGFPACSPVLSRDASLAFQKGSEQYFPVVQFVKDAVRVSKNIDFHLLTTSASLKMKAFKKYFSAIPCIIPS